ncbi:MAG: ABC transporter permease [Prevotellaceae bacterium]|jgi:putative ABC transport system permease protein|nr:ABC transporter permease [Prevotellaceae bacterium]
MRRFIKNLIIFARLIRESLVFALASVSANKLRTFLSLLGVTIGIFAIISMFTVIDALKKNINESFSAIGVDVIYIDPFPWTPEEDGEYRWWKYMQRPKNRYEEYVHLARNAKTVGTAGFGVQFLRKTTYRSRASNSSWCYGVTQDMDKIMDFDIEHGRYFSLSESQNGTGVVILGAVTAEELFKDEDPIAKSIKIGGRSAMVIGVLRKEGESMIQVNNFDNGMIVPYNFAKAMVNVRRAQTDMPVKAKAGVGVDEMQEDVRLQLRAFRRLKPVEADNFAMNRLSIIESMSEQIFGAINLGGWIIGALSLLVGLFGIANIMFVSVRERTGMIGIQKALGAKNYFILTQFLFESTLLSVIGGLMGIVLIFLGTLIVNSTSSFIISMSAENLSLGISISAVIGILAGFFPALMASRLDPVVAINKR